MIKVDKVTKFYGEFPAITDLSFEVPKGEILGFLVQMVLVNLQL